MAEDGTLKLCDFGMVKPVDADLAKREGTEIYMAPEILNKRLGETYRGVPADVFSLGVLLWIMQFAKPPFFEASSRDKNYTILQRNPESFWRLHPTIKRFEGASVDPDLKDLLTSMLSQDISKRPESIEAVVSHQFFRKEADLLDPCNNMWTDSEALSAAFSARLAELAAQNSRAED